MTIETKITEINTAITNQIAKLRIKQPEDASLLWKVQLTTLCTKEQEQDGYDCFMQRADRKFIVPDDSYDVQVIHVMLSSSTTRNFSTANSNDRSKKTGMLLICLFRKEEASNLINEALRGIGFIHIEKDTLGGARIAEDFINPNRKKWGINPDKYGLVIEYDIIIPYSIPNLDNIN